MIIVLGGARPAPGHREEMMEACRTISNASRSDEGCLAYGFHLNIDDPEMVKRC